MDLSSEQDIRFSSKVHKDVLSHPDSPPSVVAELFFKTLHDYTQSNGVLKTLPDYLKNSPTNYNQWKEEMEGLINIVKTGVIDTITPADIDTLYLIGFESLLRELDHASHEELGKIDRAIMENIDTAKGKRGIIEFLGLQEKLNKANHEARNLTGAMTHTHIAAERGTTLPTFINKLLMEGFGPNAAPANLERTA